MRTAQRGWQASRCCANWCNRNGLGILICKGVLHGALFIARARDAANMQCRRPTDTADANAPDTCEHVCWRGIIYYLNMADKIFRC